MNNNQKQDVIVVGAGLSGLSCAFELVSKGKRVTVIESHSYPGGRTSSFYDGGMHVESGLHRYIGYYTALPKLLKKCGTDIDKIVTWEDKVDILVKDQNKKIVLGLAPLLAPIKTLRGIFGNNDALSVKDKLSLLPFFISGFTSYIFSDKLDSYSVTEYANKHKVTASAQKLILEPLSSGIFFLPPDEYSAYPFFGLFAPAITRFYKMRIGAFLGGMSAVMCEPIVKKIRASGGRFIYSETVESVITKGNSVIGVQTESGKKMYAESVVIATTLPSAKKILSALKDREELKQLFSLSEMSACTIQLELTRPALEKDITTFGPQTDIVSFAEQSRTTFRGSNGRLSVILGHPDDYAEKTKEEILPTVIEQLSSLGVHIGDSVIKARKVCEKNEFYSLSKGSQHKRPEQFVGIDGLFIAGDYTLTPSFATMEGAVISGKKAAKYVLKRNKK